MASSGRGPASKVLQLGLEDVVLAERERGKGLDQIVRACNDYLKVAGASGDPRRKQTVSKSTVKRYLASLDAATVPVAHQPQVAEQNAAIAIAFGERLNRLDELLSGWLEDARDAEKIVVVGSGESAFTERLPDWQARTAVAREMREHLKAYAELMQRIHDAEEVKAFQESVVDAIREASPEVAAAVLEKLRARQSIRRAAILGV